MINSIGHLQHHEIKQKLKFYIANSSNLSKITYAIQDNATVYMQEETINNREQQYLA